MSDSHLNNLLNIASSLRKNGIFEQIFTYFHSMETPVKPIYEENLPYRSKNRWRITLEKISVFLALNTSENFSITGKICKIGT